MRVYKRFAYRFDDLRKYGKTQNHNDYRYGVKSGSNVQTKGVRDIAESGYEIPVFPMDTFRTRTAKMYGKSYFIPSKKWSLNGFMVDLSTYTRTFVIIAVIIPCSYIF